MAPANKLTFKQKIINATASLAAKGGVKKVSRKKVFATCGIYKQTNSHGNTLRHLQNKDGYIKYDKETIELTEKGDKHADPEAPIGSNRDALEEAKEKFKLQKEQAILDIVSDGRVHTRKEIGEKIGREHTKKSFGNLLGPLKKAGYIDYVKENGEAAVCGTKELIPFDE